MPKYIIEKHYLTPHGRVLVIRAEDDKTGVVLGSQDFTWGLDVKLPDVLREVKGLMVQMYERPSATLVEENIDLDAAILKAG